MMTRIGFFLLLVIAATAAPATYATIVFEETSPYHHIRVIDAGGQRTLCFDDATESRMALDDPLKGHFEYTEYFHMAWLWNAKITNVLMIGLGGASAQRSFGHYHPEVKVETIEIDPVVAQVARRYFDLKDSENQKVRIEDGRVGLRRSTAIQDLIVLDAYVGGRYGSAIPQHLATKEFFELARDHLTTNGILAYNVIGTMSGWHADIVGAMYRTMKTVFPQVYVFRAMSSLNLVLLNSTDGSAHWGPMPRPCACARIFWYAMESPRCPISASGSTACNTRNLRAPPAAPFSRMTLRQSKDWQPVEATSQGLGGNLAELFATNFLC